MEVILIKIIVITSPATDAGKTMIATGLAEAATARGKKTIFLDMDTPVGDALRVFGISNPGPYPTLSSWKVYHDPWKHSIRSKSGTFILPKPENPQEIITRSDAEKLIEECRGFDLIIADLGSDFSQPAWNLFAEKADLRLLVVDCDEKAVVRVREFLNKTSDQYDWTLVINQREEKGYYTPKQITRMLKDETIVKTVITAPYMKYITERQPQTFSPDHIFAKGILDSVWASNAIIHTLSRPASASDSETVLTADLEPQVLDEVAIDTTFSSSTESDISTNDNNEPLRVDNPASLDSTVIKQPEVVGVEVGENNYKPGKKPGCFTKKEQRKTFKDRLMLIILSSYEDLPLKSFKNKYLVDASGEFSRDVEINQDDLWRADWRLGIDAKPLKIEGVYLFAQTDCLGPVNELDQTRFIEFVEALLEEKKKPVYIIDSGQWHEELLRMGAVIVEGGF